MVFYNNYKVLVIHYGYYTPVFSPVQASNLAHLAEIGTTKSRQFRFVYAYYFTL